MSRVASVPRPPAVLFDVDGTLVDSNHLHVHAWYRAFTEAGLAVEAWRLHRSIGMDGTKLVRTLSRDVPDNVQHRLKELHDRLDRTHRGAFGAADESRGA
jgi:beta-phosphoglucomutase-like phosphatase (HAD superfamily)